MDICSMGPLPEVNHDLDCDLDSRSSVSEDESLSVEEGDCILATRLFPPPPVDIRASSTISQRLAEAYQANAEVLNPVESSEVRRPKSSMTHRRSHCKGNCQVELNQI